MRLLDVRPLSLLNATLLATALVVLAPGAPARAAEAAKAVALPTYDALLVCVLDEASHKPLPGVRLRNADAELLATTDANGRAFVPARIADESVLTLSHNGYPITVLDGSRLTQRNLVMMHHFSPGVPPARFGLLPEPAI